MYTKYDKIIESINIPEEEMEKIQKVFEKTLEAKELSKVNVGQGFSAIKTFEVLNSEEKNKAEFLIISRTPHTLSIEAKLLNKNSSLISFLLRINIYIDAKLAEVVSYQQEKPVPFFIQSPFSQSQDEKYQQNRMLTEWLENIFSNGAVEAKEINFLND